MRQDQRLLQPAGGRTLCRAALIYSLFPPSHLIENNIQVTLRLIGFDYNYTVTCTS